ncbi:DNA-binding LytR/AlgR family response regulator [Anaerotaenia torta]
MKINYYQDDTLKENRIEVYYGELDSEIAGVMNYLEAHRAIIGKRDSLRKKIFPGDIFYLEVVDRRCYAYLEQEVYQVDYSLRDFQERFYNNGFIQIGKSLLVNVYKVTHMKTDFNMKMQLQMENGETLVLNRAYKARFISFLKNMEAGNHEAD